MKRYVIFLMLLLVMPSLLAVNLDVKKLSSDETMILELNDPAIFDLYVTNNEFTDDFIIYTFFGSGYSPLSSFKIGYGETKNIKFSIKPPYTLSRTGTTIFNYFLQGSDKSEYKGELLVKVVSLGEALEVGSGSINPESNSLTIYLENKVNFNFENLKVHFSSAFFDLDEVFSLAPYEKKSFEIALNKEEFNELKAGFYTLSAKVKTENVTSNIEGIINFLEKETIIENIETYGLVVRTKIHSYSNEGNTEKRVGTSVEKNIISRLFTSFDPQPDDVVRDGPKITYFWNAILKPGEKLNIKVKTNWFLPFLMILLIVGIVFFVKEYNNTNLKLKKNVTFVKSKGGEFALKVSLLIQAKKEIENITLIEKLPPLLKLYHKFGKEEPARINNEEKKIEWEFSKLEAGERRFISYVIYSKVGVLGKFALPRTLAVYERDGKIKKSNSNKVFFLAEPLSKE